METRRILQTCLRHTPDSVDSLWAAATVEGGISLDPADTSPPPAAADSTGGKVGTRGGGLEDPNFGGQERGNAARESAAEELMRVLGLSDLAVEDEELGKGRFG